MKVVQVVLQDQIFKVSLNSKLTADFNFSKLLITRVGPDLVFLAGC